MQSELLPLCRKVGFTALLATYDEEEALLLSDRVILPSQRPAWIISEIAVALPHPRHRDGPQILRLRVQVLAQLGLSEAAE